MKPFHRFVLTALLFTMAAPFAYSAPNSYVHTTWLWHLHRPFYSLSQRIYGTKPRALISTNLPSSMSGSGPAPAAAATVLAVAPAPLTCLLAPRSPAIS